MKNVYYFYLTGARRVGHRIRRMGGGHGGHGTMEPVGLPTPKPHQPRLFHPLQPRESRRPVRCGKPNFQAEAFALHLLSC